MMPAPPEPPPAPPASLPGAAPPRAIAGWFDSAAMLALLIGALWFRVAVAVSPMHPATVGDLWTFDYNAAVNGAAGYGLTHRQPPDRLRLRPVSNPTSLREIGKSFDPVVLATVPYVTTFKAPGYIAASMIAMGVTGTTSVLPLIDLQLVLDSLVPVLTFLILRRWTNRPLALVGSVLSLFWLPQAASASVYYATAPVPFLLTLSLWLYSSAVDRQSLLRLALFGVVSLTVVFLRVELVFIPLLLTAYLFVLPLDRKRALVGSLAVVTILTSGVFAWMTRNYVTTGYWSVTSQMGAALWEGMGYESSLFPEYKGLYADYAIRDLYKSRGLPLESQSGHFYDGPMGMEVSRNLVGLFWTEVVRARPLDLALHLAYKTLENYRRLRNWHDAVVDFGHAERYRLLIAAGWMDEVVRVLPWLCLCLIPWRDPRQRILGAPLVCLLGIHLALTITVSGPLRYTAPVSPCYPILIAVALWSITGQRRSRLDVETPLRTGVTLLAIGTVMLVFIWARSAAWPPTPSRDRMLDLTLMPIQTATHLSMSPTGLTLTTPDAAPETNLAAGRPAIFYLKPYYPSTTSPDDANQLTDGQVSSKPDYASPSWVGWGMHAPEVFIGIPLQGSPFVTQIRVHTVQETFPIARVSVWEGKGSDRALIRAQAMPASKSGPGWLTISVKQRLANPIIGLAPTDVNDRYVFIDEIEVLGTEPYVPTGEFVSTPVRLLHRTEGVPSLVGDLPEGTTARLWYRQANATEWQSEGWDGKYYGPPVQFRVELGASPDLRRGPSIRYIRLPVR